MHKKTKRWQRLAAKKKRKRMTYLYLSGNRSQMFPFVATSEQELQAYYDNLPPQRRAGNIHVDTWFNGKSKHGKGFEKMVNFKKLIMKPNGKGRIWLNDWPKHINLDLCSAMPRFLVDYGAVRTTDKKGRRVYVMP